jgi:glycosyltransferase involved in cell wall biosynthesis
MRREAAAFRRYEAAMLRAYDAVLTVTEEDRELLLALQSEMYDVRSTMDDGRCTKYDVRCTKSIQHRPSNIVHPTSSIQHRPSNITVIPICVDPTQVAPIARSPGNQSTNLPTHQSTDLPIYQPTILHLGTMFWPPNVAGVLWFAREVLPLVWREAPAARFVIIGKNPPAEVQALAADPRIEVTGYVADPQPYLEAADAFIVPLFSGGGMRVKILDAWLWGLPIVATPLGAEGIAVRDGENILLAAGAPAFAAAVRRLLTDPDLNAHLRTAGRAWVEQTYSWQVVYRKVDEVYTRLLGGEEKTKDEVPTADH